jgi:hypothetical protein
MQIYICNEKVLENRGGTMVYDLLKKHPFFYEVDTYENENEKLFGFKKGKYSRYSFLDSEGGELHIFVPIKNGEFQWIYHFPTAPFFIQSIASPSTNGPLWMQILLKDLKVIYQND